jgi:hypothetical protein
LDELLLIREQVELEHPVTRRICIAIAFVFCFSISFCQIKKTEIIKSLEIEKFVDLNNLTKVDCKDLPVGIYGYRIYVSKTKKLVTSLNASFPVLNEILTSAISKAVNQQAQMAKGNYLQLVFFDDFEHCKDEPLPNYLSIDSSTWTKENLNRAVAELLNKRARSIEQSIVQLIDKKVLPEKLVYLPIAHIGLKQNKKKHIRPVDNDTNIKEIKSLEEKVIQLKKAKSLN